MGALLSLESGRRGKKRAAEAEALSTSGTVVAMKRAHDEMLAASAWVAGPDVDAEKKGKKAKIDGAAADKENGKT